MSTVIRQDQQVRIEQLVRQGAYPDEAAVIDDALSLAERQARFMALVQEGIDDLNAGRVIDCKTAFGDARRAIAEIAMEKAAGQATP